jgi:hypothetical protein
LETCPARQLTLADAAALRAMVHFVAGRRVTAISLASDVSQRGIQAAAVVRAAAARDGLPVVAPGVRGAPGPARQPLFVTSGWAEAQAFLREVAAGRYAAEGTYLAPWLLNGPLLTIPAGQLLALRFDTRDPMPLRYLDSLTARFPGEPPTGVGFTQWLPSMADGADPLRLYAASQLFVPGNQDHPHHGAQWITHGTVTAVTGPLDPGPAT